MVMLPSGAALLPAEGQSTGQLPAGGQPSARDQPSAQASPGDCSQAPVSVFSNALPCAQNFARERGVEAFI